MPDDGAHVMLHSNPAAGRAARSAGSSWSTSATRPVDEADQPRDLERRDPPAAVRDQLLRRGLGAGQQLDERRRHLQQPLVGHPDDLRELDRRVRAELGLDLLRRDVLAADLQRLLDAAEEQHGAVLVQHAEVGHRHPAAGRASTRRSSRATCSTRSSVFQPRNWITPRRARAGTSSPSSSTTRSSRPGWQRPQVFSRTSSGSSGRASVTGAALGAAVGRQLDRVREPRPGTWPAPRAARR